MGESPCRLSSAATSAALGVLSAVARRRGAACNQHDCDGRSRDRGQYGCQLLHFPSLLCASGKSRWRSQSRLPLAVVHLSGHDEWGADRRRGDGEDQLLSFFIRFPPVSEIRKICTTALQRPTPAFHLYGTSPTTDPPSVSTPKSKISSIVPLPCKLARRPVPCVITQVSIVRSRIRLPDECPAGRCIMSVLPSEQSRFDWRSSLAQRDRG